MDDKTEHALHRSIRITDFALCEGLLTIYQRYYRGGLVRHSWECMIYRSLEVYSFCFCDCGLLHDLNKVHHLAEVLYPKVSADQWLQDHQEPYKPENPAMQEGWDEADKILCEAFGAPSVPELGELKYNYEQDKKAIEEMFGNCPDMLKRLSDKLSKDMKDRWKYEKYRK